MEEYTFTKKQFRKFVNGKTGTAEFSTPFIDIQDLTAMSIDGLNEFCLDDVVEDGYMLQDVTYKADKVNKKGQVSIRVFVADASEWLGEYESNLEGI